MPALTLLPDPTQLHVLGFTATSTTITASVVATASQACCPLCGHASSRVHSRYVRRVSDLPWHGVALRLELHVQRFFCDQPDCPRQIFTQRLPGVVVPYARRTERLQDWFVAVGYAAGGEAGARLLRVLGLAGSPDTLLRSLRRTQLLPRATPRVLSVDDWGIRRGRRYGTILVDLERHCPVDLLPDRSAGTFASWLREHPGVEIISRDRGGAYAEGAHNGAPEAVQVADRWHLLKNLGDALEQYLRRERVQLPLSACPGGAGNPDTTDAGADTDADSVRAAPTQAEDPAHDTAISGPPALRETEHAATAAPSRRQERFTLVHARRQAGASVRAIAQELGMARNTVRRYLRAGHCPDWRRGRRRTLLDRYQGYLLQRWTAGCHNGSQLFREIRAQGYSGGASQVGVFMARLREQLPATPTPTPPPRPPSPRDLRWLLTRRPEDLADAERAYLHALLRADAAVAMIYALVQRFGRMVRERQAGDLDMWLADAMASGIPEVAGFVQGIQRDRAAVEAGLTLEWSQGQTEGQVNRLKLLKRAMYGRAKLDLLRQRVLHRNAS